MTLYSHYPNLPAPLPERITLPDGDTRTQLYNLSYDELATYGYYPVTEIRPDLQAGEQYAAPTLVLADGVVTATYPAEPIPPPPPPQSVTMRQARLALLGAGLLNAVTAAIDALPSPQKEAAQIEWEYSNDLLRQHGLVPALCSALNLSDAEVDALFVAAASL